MAHTARNDDEKKEYFDPPDVLVRKVDQLVEMIRESKHMIAFTGAGISTGAGIPDFRSGMDTALATGPGKWELMVNKEARPPSKKQVITSILKAIPTPTHMMIVKLYETGILKCCVSQNVDGLHRRSGLPKIGLCELHGNTNLERCKKCGKEYLRDFRVRNAKKVKAHLTGRECDDSSCKGPLRDSIVNFGENLPQEELTRGEHEGEVADLCLAMGSSLTVTPAADIPEEVAKRGKQLVIVNLQRTPLDPLASLIIHAKCEEVSTMVMERLRLEIPEFVLTRRIEISTAQSSMNETSALLVAGRDMDGLPFTFFKEVVIIYAERLDTMNSLVKPPFVRRVCFEDGKNETKMQLKIVMHGNYGEPPITREFIVKKGAKQYQSLLLQYSTVNKTWTVTEEEGPVPMVTGAMALLGIK